MIKNVKITLVNIHLVLALNETISVSSGYANSCYKCSYVKNDPSTACSSIAYCFEPKKYKEKLQELGCITQCSDSKPYCYSVDMFANGELVSTEKACKEVDNNYIDPTYNPISGVNNWPPKVDQSDFGSALSYF